MKHAGIEEIENIGYGEGYAHGCGDGMGGDRQLTGCGMGGADGACSPKGHGIGDGDLEGSGGGNLNAEGDGAGHGDGAAGDEGEGDTGRWA